MRHWRIPFDAERIERHLGEVFIIADRCKGCAFCVEYCPRDVLVMSDAFNRKGYHPPEVVKHGECVNCALCEMICPEFAIFSLAASEAKTTSGTFEAETDPATADRRETSS